MVLRSQDFIVALKFAATVGRTLNTELLSKEIGLGLAQTHDAIGRAVMAQLIVQIGVHRDRRGRPGKRITPNIPAILELAQHGLRYVFVPERGKLTRGIPTASSAAPLRNVLAEPATPTVWPDPKGHVRGESFEPLHPCVLTAARADPTLYELIALVDAIRGGSAREREAATALLQERLARGAVS